MKHLLVILLIVLMASFSFGQKNTKKEELSNAEVFSKKAGTLIKQEHFEISRIRRVRISVVHYTDMITSEKVSAIRFEYNVSMTTGAYHYPINDSKIAYLDSDELDGLIKSIKLMLEKVFRFKPETYSEIAYRSRDGFKAGCYWNKTDWMAYLKLEQFDSDSKVLFKKEDFPKLLATLEKAKEML